MIVSFLQMQSLPTKITERVNLGKILIDFLYSYSHFESETFGISAYLPGKKPEKPNHYSLIQFLMLQSHTIQIDDPLNPHNNVGKSSFRFDEIKVLYYMVKEI